MAEETGTWSVEFAHRARRGVNREHDGWPCSGLGPGKHTAGVQDRSRALSTHRRGRMF